MSKESGPRGGDSSPAKPVAPPAHPGEILQEEFLRPLGLDPRALAPRVGILTEQLLDLLDGRARVTPELAEKLGGELHTSSELWLASQAAWDAWERRQDPR